MEGEFSGQGSDSGLKVQGKWNWLLTTLCVRDALLQKSEVTGIYFHDQDQGKPEGVFLVKDPYLVRNPYLLWENTYSWEANLESEIHQA